MNPSIFHFAEPVGFGNDLLRIHNDTGTGTGTGTAHLRSVMDLANAWGG